LFDGGLDSNEYAKVDVFGTDLSDIGNDAFSFAASIDLNILTPKANLIGHYWVGSITFGQLFREQGSQASIPGGEVTI
jgi:hypothetical protein